MMAPTGTVSEASIDLPERLDFAACEPLAKAIDETRGTALCLQADKVRFLGALAAELLLRARAEWLSEGGEFNLLQPSEEFLQGLGLLGIPRSELIQEDSE